MLNAFFPKEMFWSFAQNMLRETYSNSFQIRSLQKNIHYLRIAQEHMTEQGILLFKGVQKLRGPEVSRFLPCLQQFLDKLRWLFIFSNCIREIDHFTLDLRYLTLDLLKIFSLWIIRKKTTMNKSLNARLQVGILDLLKKSSKTREASIKVVHN